MVADAEEATAACRRDVRVNTVRELPVCRSFDLVQCDVNELGRDRRRAGRKEADMAARIPCYAGDIVLRHKINDDAEQEVLIELRVYEAQVAFPLRRRRIRKSRRISPNPVMSSPETG